MEDTKNKVSETANRPKAYQICLVWLVGSFIIMIVSGQITTEILGMSLMLPFDMTFIAIAFSIFHPGGWLLIGGLITALVRKHFAWLLLSAAGAVLIGMTAPMIEGIGAMHF